MISRRVALGLFSASIGHILLSQASAAPVKRLVFIHGRGQGGGDSEILKSAWMEALRRGAQAIGQPVPGAIDVAFPFYADALDKFARDFDLPLTSDIRAKGGPVQDEYLAFQAQVAEDIRKKAGVTDAEVDAEYGTNPRPKGPLNWEWVQAILRALDQHGGGMSQRALEAFTRDVFLYTTRAGVRDEIDRIVSGAVTEEPTIVVGHSLGSVVGYSVLRSDRRQLRVPLFITLGSPLGVRPIRDQFRPLKNPAPVAAWYNAYDPRDVVALYPLDGDNFPISPAIQNHDRVNNHTDDRHGIAGYLDDAGVTRRILQGFAA